jgi:hypothetical protein
MKNIKWWHWLLGMLALGAIGNLLPDDSAESPGSKSASESGEETTTTQPEPSWDLILNSTSSRQAVLAEACGEFQPIMDSTSQTIEKRRMLLDQNASGAREAEAYFREIDWDRTIHVDEINRQLDEAAEPLLTTAAAPNVPTQTQLNDFVEDAIEECGLATSDSRVQALSLDSRLSGLRSSILALPWFPEGFREIYSSGIAVKKSETRKLSCYSCSGIVYEVISRDGCPSSLYVEANFLDSSGAIFDYSNDVVRSLSPLQIAYIELVTYSSSGGGTVEITDVNCR